MTNLDFKTLALIGLLTSLFLPLVMLAVGQLTSRDQATRAWMRGVFLYSLGFLGLALRNAVPDLLSIVVANTLIVAGYAELLHGVRFFFGRRVDRRWMWLVLPVFAAMFATLLTGDGSFEKRVALSSMVFAALTGAITLEFLTAARRAHLSPEVDARGERNVLLVVGCIFFFSAIAMGLRAYIFFATVVLALQPSAAHQFFSTAAYLNAIVINMVLASCLPLLVSHRIQRKLNSSEASLVHAQELAGLGTAVTDLDTKVIASNPIFRKLLGFAPDYAFTFDEWRKLVHPDDRRIVRQAILDVVAGRIAVTNHEVRVTRSNDGALRWFNLASTVQANPASSNQLLMTTVRDITAIKASEIAALQAREEANLANSAKSSFLANMSHEIRTPMNGIIGLTELALHGELADSQRNLVQKAHDSAQSLLGIINDILDFSKIEAGKLEVEAVPFDLSRPLEQAQNMFSQFADSKGITFSLEVAPSVPRGLVGDGLRLSQVLTNLVGNAVKFTEKGGVQLCVNRVPGGRSPGQDDQSVTLQFSVRDSGIGITPEQQKRLFEPFTQADGSTTRRFGGTGLGLVICRQLVDLMGGSLTLCSEAQKGTTFTATLPFGLSDTAMAERRIKARQPITSLEGLRVLLVEDNAINSMVATMLLKSKGAVVTCAVNGQLALDQLHATPDRFDVVLMDVQMPVMDGREATRQIRQDKRFNDIPIIAATADAMAEDRQKCLQAGMDDYLTKPLNSTALFDMLVKWCKR